MMYGYTLASIALKLVLLVSIQHHMVADASCRFSDPGFKTTLKGPDVTQKSTSGAVTVTVCWMAIIKNPDCADEYNIYYWKKLTESQSRAKKVHVGTKARGEIDKHTHQHDVTGLAPDIEYVFIVEVIEKTTKRKSGPTSFRTKRTMGGGGGSMGGHGGSGGSMGGYSGSRSSFGSSSSSRRPSYTACTQQNSLLKTDGGPRSSIKVEYYYSNITRKYDMRKVIITLDKNEYVRYPECIKYLKVSAVKDATIETQYARHRISKRSIGQLSGQNRGASSSHSSSSSSSYSSSSYSSSSSSRGSSGGGSRPSHSVAAHKTFIHPGSGRPGYGQAAWEETGIGGRTVKLLIDNILPCNTYRFTIDVTTVLKSRSREEEKKIGTISNIILPPMAYVHNFRLPLLSKVLKFTERGSTINIGYQTLGNSIPASCLMKYVAAVDAKLSRNEGSSSLRGGSSHGGHGGMVIAPRPSHDDAALKILKQKGCECHNTVYLNLSTATPSNNKKYKIELGLYKTEGKLHATKPYWVSVGRAARYIYWDNSHRTWYLSDRLGKSSGTLQMEKNVGTSCPADLKKTGQLTAHGKYWQTKSTFGWSKDKKMKLQCHVNNRQLGESCGSCMCPPTFTMGDCAHGLECQHNPMLQDAAGKCVRQGTRPIHPTSRPNHHGGGDVVQGYLRSKTCNCHDTAYLNLTSTDSRTNSNHKDQLGLYKTEGARSVHATKPYWKKVTPSKTYYLYWVPTKHTWYISDILGKNKGLLQMDSNANGVCPSNTARGKYWERKNSFGVMADDRTMKVNCKGPDKHGWTGSSSGGSMGSSGGHFGHGSSSNLNKLTSAGCKCHNKDKVKISSTDGRTNSKHKLQLGIYDFTGMLHNGRPYYVNRAKSGQPKTYYMYWNLNDKTWWIGENINDNKALLKMQNNSSLKCPADPLGVGASKKYWQRKNSVGWWGDDQTATVRCGV